MTQIKLIGFVEIVKNVSYANGGAEVPKLKKVYNNLRLTIFNHVTMICQGDRASDR